MTKNQIIQPQDIIPTFLEICPDFRISWNEHLELWESEKNRGLYNDVAPFAHFIVESYAKNETEKFDDIFKAIEQFLTKGNKETKELISTGLLEDIQTIASHQSFGYSVFEKWLGPLSLEQWRKIESLWQGKSSLSEIIRSR